MYFVNFQILLKYDTFMVEMLEGGTYMYLFTSHYTIPTKISILQNSPLETFRVCLYLTTACTLLLSRFVRCCTGLRNRMKRRVQCWLSSLCTSIMSLSGELVLYDANLITEWIPIHLHVHVHVYRTKVQILRRGVDMKVRIKTMLHFIAIMKVTYTLHAHPHVHVMHAHTHVHDCMFMHIMYIAMCIYVQTYISMNVARHLGGSASCWWYLGVPKQALGWLSPWFGIGCRR